MWVADFDFELPAERIAQRALPRGESRLLVLDAAGGERHRGIRDLPALLRAGDLLVVNDTRVIPARLFGRRIVGPQAAAGEGGGRVELLLVERAEEPVWQGGAGGGESWRCLVKPGRKAKPGTRLQLEMAADGSPSAITAEVIAATASGQRLVHFSEPLAPHLDSLGHVPLPPYIQRADTPEDQQRYQTLFASKPGAIAAPTAGLHFDPATLAALAERGIERATVTLHVGIGTFKPVTAKLVHEHRMDAERYEVPAATAEMIAATRRRGGRVVAVGTTVVRTLETAAIEDGGTVEPGAGSSELFITPGFPFHAVDGLLTNFHLPRSTLLMLVSAFAGKDRVLAAYREAIEREYRFYSYGDAMFAWRAMEKGA
jgi:S-adenosylmethionine:tRNA ribosyltransferase-isomerase